MLTIQNYSSKILDQYISSYSIYRFSENTDIQLMPKGVFEIVFQSSSHFQHNTSYSSGWQSRPQNFVGGLHNKSYHVRSNGNNNFCVVVEFKPNTAKYFIPCQLHDFQNDIVDITEIWGNDAYELTQQITALKNDSNKISLIEEFLKYKIIKKKQSVIDNSVNLIIASKGFVEVSELARKACLSNAQFRKRFKEEIGISPSQYCKIVRINTTLDLFEKSYQKPLVELSYQLGYFDQSHFIKDFKSVTGFSPRSFKK